MGDLWNRHDQITPINHIANAFVTQLSHRPRIAESDLFRFRSGMGKNAPQVPLWVKTLDSLIEAGVRVTVSCTQCSKHDIVDLKLLRERVGGDYSLWNRRCRCRLSLDCKGWNRFRYVSGMAWPMWDDEGAKRWEG